MLGRHTATGTLLRIILLAGIVIYLCIESRDRDDFWIYYSGSRDMLHGENMYLNIYNSWYHYLYSVFFAVLIYPLTLLPFFAAKLLWLTLNFLLLCRIVQLVLARAGLERLTEKYRTWLPAMLLVFFLHLIHENFHCGQITLAILFLCVEGIERLQRGSMLSGALLIALGINVKLLPAILLPWMLYRGYFAAIFWTIAFVSLMYFLPSLLIGHARNMELLATWWGMMNPALPAHIVDTYDRGFHGLSTFFAVYLYDVTPDPNGYGTRINIASLSVRQLSWVLNAARLALLAAAIFFSRAPVFKRASSGESAMYEVAYLLCIVPLIFPHQHAYAFVFQLPAFAFILCDICERASLPSRPGLRIRIPLVLLVFLLFNLPVLLGEFRDFYEHFKLITFGGLITPFLLYGSGARVRNTAAARFPKDS